MISFVNGMGSFLCRSGVLLKNFGAYADSLTRTLMSASLAEAERFGRPVVYLESAATDKEQEARAIAQRDKITDGLVCILKSVEPCQGFDIHRSRAEKRLVLVSRRRKCLHLYHYFIDPFFGWMHARIQTWLPFTIQVCINGREWLAHRLDEERIRYRREENGFLWIAEPKKAQTLMDGLLRTDWPAVLAPFAHRLNPAHEEMFRIFPMPYYWTARQSEWAIDFMFRSRQELAALYSPMTRGAIECFSCEDILRFLGRKLHGGFTGEVTGSYRERPEGVRIKHAANGNSVKAYDKFGSILRIETTITNPRDFKVFRTPEDRPEAKRKWLKMRRGVADLRRRAEISQKCAERYSDALANLDTSTPLGELVAPVCRRAKYHGRALRGLKPWTAEDLKLLTEVNRGEHALSGFRNHNVALAMSPDGRRSRQSSAKATRLLRLLRAHHLIAKVPRTHRYQVTFKGRQIITAILKAQHVSLEQLNKAAA
jgi:hypothetical protein